MIFESNFPTFPRFGALVDYGLLTPIGRVNGPLFWRASKGLNLVEISIGI
jgi:hypothetical protein